MTVHNKMFDGKEKKDRTYHRIYVEFKGGYFISLGVVDPEFQKMVEAHGDPNIVEFRDTDEKWNIDDERAALSTSAVSDYSTRTDGLSRKRR